MYARYLTFKSSPEHRDAIEAMADGMYEYIKTLQGFVSVTYVLSEDETMYGSFSVWETKADADNAGIALGEKLSSLLEGKAASAPEVVTMEVYLPG